MYAHLYVHIYIYIYICIYIYIYAHVHLYIYSHKYLYMHLYVDSLIYVYMYLHLYLYIYLYICLFKYISIRPQPTTHNPSPITHDPPPTNAATSSTSKSWLGGKYVLSKSRVYIKQHIWSSSLFCRRRLVSQDFCKHMYSFQLLWYLSPRSEAAGTSAREAAREGTRSTFLVSSVRWAQSRCFCGRHWLGVPTSGLCSTWCQKASTSMSWRACSWPLPAMWSLTLLQHLEPS